MIYFYISKPVFFSILNDLIGFKKNMKYMSMELSQKYFKLLSIQVLWL